MRLAITIANLLLLVASVLFAVVATYASLLAGLSPIIGFGITLLWTVLTLAAYRLATVDTALFHWRKALPFLWLALSIFCFNTFFEFMRQRYLQDHGPPRRYFSWDTEK